MKVSDYIIKRLEEHGVRDIFLLSGGGMMHLLDSLYQSETIQPYCNLHEQASSICADAYAQATGDLAVCMVTSGPGATNAITGAVNSYIDSEPVLVISGQAKTSDLVGDRGVRQCGSQEVNISGMMACVTKYVVTIHDKTMVQYHLDKAIYLATHGRKGTTWVDVPLDIQGAQIEEYELVAFDPVAEGLVPGFSASDEDCNEILAMMRAAKRPLILLGKGIQADKMEAATRALCARLQLPALATWRAKMVFADDDDLYFGHPGSPGPRYANWILQTCDFLLIVGSRLNPGITAFNEPHFARKAKRVLVDIDANEIAKLNMPFAKTLVCDAATFITRLSARAADMPPLDTAAWLTYCRAAKVAYPLHNERQVAPQTQTDMYRFGHALSVHSRADDVIVSASSGRASVILGLGYARKQGQVQIGAMGLGSMGFTLPAAIGACIACDKRRTITLDGDGSLQHNLQELALIRGYGLPIKLFIMSNNGYASIAMMQETHFKGRYAACNTGSGVFCCDMRKLADLYDLAYHAIHDDSEIEQVLARVLADDAPVLCEVFCDYTFDEIPKAVSRINADGTLSSSVLEDLSPFLAKEETEKWLSIAE